MPKDSVEITRLYECGKILQMKDYLEKHPDQVSDEMKEIILDDFKFYEFG